MVKSLLSDDETETVMALWASGNVISLIKFFNRLLYAKGMGDDLCARPLALRDKEHIALPCFAVGYLDKLMSYTEESHARSPKKFLKETQDYHKKLKAEINRFFEKERGRYGR